MYVTFVKLQKHIAILQTQFLNCYFEPTFFLIHMPFGASVHADHINMCAEGNLASYHTFWIKGAQSWKKSQNSTIFVIFAIFDELWIFVLRATTWNLILHPAYATI